MTHQKLSTIVLAILAVAFVLMAVVAVANSATYYVATNGSDTANGSQSAPWKTLHKAIGNGTTLVPGDIVIVKPGTYAGVQVFAEGAAGQEIRIEAEVSRSVLITTSGSAQNNDLMDFAGQTSSYLHFKGLYFKANTVGDRGVHIVGLDHVTFEDCRFEAYAPVQGGPMRMLTFKGCEFESMSTVSNSGAHLLYLSGGAYASPWNELSFIVEDCYFGRNPHTGSTIWINPNDPSNQVPFSNSVIRRSAFNNSESNGHDIATSSPGIRIENCVFYGSRPNRYALQLAQTAINKYYAAVNTEFCNNTVVFPNSSYFSRHHNPDATGTPYATGTRYWNNIILCGNGPIWNGTSGTYDYLESNNIIAPYSAGLAEALMLDPANANFTLLDDSDAINAGLASFMGSSSPATDYANNERPIGAAWDQGAFEWLRPPDTEPDPKWLVVLWYSEDDIELFEFTEESRAITFLGNRLQTGAKLVRDANGNIVLTRIKEPYTRIIAPSNR